MKAAPWFLLIRGAALVALAASGALLADYTGLSPTYCGAGSGCAAVRQAGYGYVGLAGIFVPVPALGTIAFATLLTFSLLGTELGRKLTVWASILAGVLGLALIALQALVIQALCTLCLAADISGIVAGVGGAFLLAPKSRASLEPLKTQTWALLGTLAFIAPWYWPQARPAPAVPLDVQKLYQPGKINVVEFADFECPHCRRLFPVLEKLNQEYGDRVHFVRLNMPLPAHEFAQDAARAFVCADQQGRGDSMSAKLFKSQLLTPEALHRIAGSENLDLAEFDKCTASIATDRRIDKEAQILKQSGFEGLPTTYVGSDKILGAQPEEVFRASYERTARGVGQRGVPAPLYVGISLLAAVLLIVFGRAKGPGAASEGV